MRKQSFWTLAISGALILATAGISVAANEDVMVTLDVDCPADVTAPDPFSLEFVDSDTGSLIYKSDLFDVVWDPGCGYGALEAEITDFTDGMTNVFLDSADLLDSCPLGEGTSVSAQNKISELFDGQPSTDSFCLLIRIADDTPDGTYTATLSFTVFPN